MNRYDIALGKQPPIISKKDLSQVVGQDMVGRDLVILKATLPNYWYAPMIGHHFKIIADVGISFQAQNAKSGPDDHHLLAQSYYVDKTDCGILWS